MANICYQYEVIISLSASASTTEKQGIFFTIFFDVSEVNLLVFEEQMDLGLENPRSDSRSSVHYTYKLSYPWIVRICEFQKRETKFQGIFFRFFWS